MFLTFWETSKFSIPKGKKSQCLNIKCHLLCFLAHTFLFSLISVFYYFPSLFLHFFLSFFFLYFFSFPFFWIWIYLHLCKVCKQRERWNVSFWHLSSCTFIAVCPRSSIPWICYIFLENIALHINWNNIFKFILKILTVVIYFAYFLIYALLVHVNYSRKFSLLN